MIDRFVICVVVVPAAILTGCEGVGPPGGEGAHRETNQVLTPPVAKAKPLPQKTNRKEKTGRALTSRAVPPRRPRPHIKSLIGKSESELTKFLGVPNAVRNEPPALVWNYRGKRCAVDVFLYLDVGEKSFRSLAYRFYPETRVKKVQRDCLAEIRRARRKPRVSN
ncbi:MAG: hypothetical protein R3229_13710 [Alphaproteobacteria bacterium]|nr:hypothetical protein [Alphaproteobacteria bacterium]